MLCRDRFKQDAFGKVTTRWNEWVAGPSSGPATHLPPLRGLESSYEIFTDPTVQGDRYQWQTSGAWRFETNERRQRLYLFAYLAGRMVGHLSASSTPNRQRPLRGIPRRTPGPPGRPRPVGWRIPPLVAALLRKARPRPGRSSKLTGASAAISLGMALEQAELHRSACRLGA
jgi:hypothetical protein